LPVRGVYLEGIAEWGETKWARAEFATGPYYRSLYAGDERSGP
jgi:hypothetical protein